MSGCKRDSSEQAWNDAATTQKAYRDVSDFKKSVNSLDVLTIQRWAVDESLSNAFLSVTGRIERIALLDAIEKEMSTMQYASVDARKCRYLYSAVARAYSAVQDSYWNYADAPALAIECLFAEIRHFKAEIDRCRREIKANTFLQDLLQECVGVFLNLRDQITCDRFQRIVHVDDLIRVNCSLQEYHSRTFLYGVNLTIIPDKWLLLAIYEEELSYIVADVPSGRLRWERGQI